MFVASDRGNNLGLANVGLEAAERLKSADVT
jgi:hypothetical protein